MIVHNASASFKAAKRVCSALRNRPKWSPRFSIRDEGFPSYPDNISARFVFNILDQAGLKEASYLTVALPTLFAHAQNNLGRRIIHTRIRMIAGKRIVKSEFINSNKLKLPFRRNKGERHFLQIEAKRTDLAV